MKLAHESGVHNYLTIDLIYPANSEGNGCPLRVAASKRPSTKTADHLVGRLIEAYNRATKGGAE